ncbi:MAG: hypothetical protein ACYC6N_05075 [Pirellulaceae bacterium]
MKIPSIRGIIDRRILVNYRVDPEVLRRIALSPEFYRHTFRGVPEGGDQMFRYAWVGGSIWGIQSGGLASVIVGSILFRAKWRQLQEAADCRTSQRIG